MQINKFRLLNYKGFRDSGWLSLPRGTTVVVGQNNSGKTALLESFRLTGLPSRPHRNLSRDEATPLDPTSYVQIELSMTGLELLQSILHEPPGSQPVIPCPLADATPTAAQDYLDNLFRRDRIPVNLTAGGGSISPTEYPSLGFPLEPNGQNRGLSVEASSNRLFVRYANTQNSAADHIPMLAGKTFARTIYVFKAERLNIGRTKATQASVLSPDGSNLAAVLMNMQSNPSRFQRFKKHVVEIFPNIKELAVSLTEDDCEVRLWSVETERDDLAIPLQESGTGIGQVLAILYVALNITSGLIVIDEPNTFLHPGAAKKLIQILQTYNSNQYVLATHSAELIATAQPDALLLVSWANGESHVEALDGKNLADLQKVLGEVGVSFSDVFGYERAVWVEGPTEEICFPLILKVLGRETIKGTVFIAVKNTGDFEKKTNQRKLIWDIYSRLSSGLPLLPTAVVFSFDRENRNDTEIHDLTRSSGGRVRFLPRLTFENYLLVPDAIAAILNVELEDQSVTSDQVADCLRRNGQKHAAHVEWNREIGQSTWLEQVHAPNLLRELFSELSAARVEFRKTIHSVSLVEWLLINQPTALDEIANYILDLSRNG